MSKIVFRSQYHINPTTAPEAVLRSTKVDNVSGTIAVTVDYVATDGTVLSSSVLKMDSAAVKTWIANHEATILSMVLTRLGVSGTVS